MEKRIKALIAEDEVPAMEELKYLLEKTGKVDVIDTASEGNTALEKINRLNPDVAFLDIHMPGMSGIEVAERVRDIKDDCLIVFATAYDEHAIKAFELDAADYVLKPYNEDRINLTVDRIEKKYAPKDDFIERINNFLVSLSSSGLPSRGFAKIPCEQFGRIILIDEDDIIFSYIEDEQTYVKTANKKYFTSFTLSELEGKSSFFRVHRSYLVNLNKIKEMYPWFHGTYKIVMQDDDKTEIPVSRNNVKRLKDIFGI